MSASFSSWQIFHCLLKKQNLFPVILSENNEALPVQFDDSL